MESRYSRKITTQHVAQGLCLIPLSIFDFGGGALLLMKSRYGQVLCSRLREESETESKIEQTRDWV
jgi:hypothetical protein